MSKLADFHIYATPHMHSQTVCAALETGTRFRVVPPAPLLDGGVAMYGFLRGLLPTLNAARELGRPWVYIDRGYFGATYGDDYRGYFRVTRDALQIDGIGQFEGTPTARWWALGLEPKPWRTAGTHVLVCPPGDVFTRAVGGFAAADWERDTLAALRKDTDRPIRIRRKGGPTPLVEDLKDCWALVTYMSNTAVEAILAGVPTFCTGPCAGRYVGCDLSEIEYPITFDREPWAAALANGQFTLAELRAGKGNHLFQ
jgi:hypothetical protein